MWPEGVVLIIPNGEADRPLLGSRNRRLNDWEWSGAAGGGTAPASLKSIAAFWDEAVDPAQLSKCRLLPEADSMLSPDRTDISTANEPGANWQPLVSGQVRSILDEPLRM